LTFLDFPVLHFQSAPLTRFFKSHRAARNKFSVKLLSITGLRVTQPEHITHGFNWWTLKRRGMVP